MTANPAPHIISLNDSKHAKTSNLQPEGAVESLLELVQKQTFGYFWQFAHPVCGLARERNHEYYKNVITTGGSGFGIMAMVVAVQRKWITKEDFLSRIKTIISFLLICEKYRGAFSHWYDGNTGKTIPFAKKDDGADLVETAFLMVGLITLRQYLTQSFETETSLVHHINMIWLQVEWDWFKCGKEVLYWHWRPGKKKQVGLKIEGYNEALITYILAASSPTHAIDKTTYDKGWARNGDQKNGNSFYNIELPLGVDFGGPLFWSQYGFLGLDPRGLKDEYADYWKQNVNHSKINRAYCIDNPKIYRAFAKNCWGLSACDSGRRYKPHSPLNDNGTICPSAAIAAMPYLPEASIAALQYFYTEMGGKIWGDFGFYDAFNKSRSWYARSYLAVNQGPVILMLENYRTGLLWQLFMSAPEVGKGLKKLGFDFGVQGVHRII